MRYLSVCSGYCAATVAWRDLGWECAGFAEIDAFPSAMLGAHYGASRPRYMPDPDAAGLPAKERNARIAYRSAIAKLSDDHFGNQVVNFGDFTQIREDDVGPIDLLVGGTPCQSFSQAGKRLGLDDPRGNLSLEFLALARRLRPRWLAWENVTGILSHDGGRTLGIFLGLLGQLGYRWAYRVLDAQWVRVPSHPRAVPQRRRRIILVGYLGDGPNPAAVLFDPEGMRGDSPPRREPGQGIARSLAAGSPGGSGYRNDADTAENLIADVAGTITAGSRKTDHAGSVGGGLIAKAFGGGNTSGPIDVAACLTAKGQRVDFEVESFVAQPIGFNSREDCVSSIDVFGALGTSSPQAQALAYAINADVLDRTGEAADGSAKGRAGLGVQEEVAYSLRAGRTDAVAFDTTQITSKANGSNPQPGDPCHPLARGAHPPALAYPVEPYVLMERGRNGTPNLEYRADGTANAILTPNGGRGGLGVGAIAMEWQVRRLTPTECERLMGLPDGFTAITYRGKPAADGPRYKVLGNSMARNMMRWIGASIQQADDAWRMAERDRAA